MEKEKKSLDLSALDTTRGAEQGAELQLSHPRSGELIPARISLLGADSSAWLDKHREFQRRRADRLNRTRKFVVSPEDLEAEQLELLVVATTGWDWSGITLEGEPVPAFSADAARRIYKRFGWVREQVDAFVQDRANFLPRSASG